MQRDWPRAEGGCWVGRMTGTFSRIAIVGAGAIGTYYGVRLGLAGADVRFLLRGDLDAVRARGTMAIHEKGQRTGTSVRREGGSGEKEKAHTLTLRPAQVFGSAEEIGHVDLVIVTLKTTANDALSRLLPPLLGDDTAVLTLQNGLGSDEAIAAQFGAERVLGGLAFIASTRTAPGEVTCYHPGSITLGEFGRPAAARTRAFAEQFTAAGVKVKVVDDLLAARWHKLVWNIPFNGLAIAAGGITTDRICADPALAARVRRLMAEVQRAAAAFGIAISDEFCREQFDVTPPMGAYRPSSLVDFLAGREVEIDAIWSEPLRRARAAGATMPELEKLHEEIQACAGRG